MEGPRGATPADTTFLKELVGHVFRPTLFEEYPQLFNDDNLGNCRIILEGGKPVSHIGMTLQDATILGCHLRVACIGGVATHPDHRGKGYATRLFEDAGEVAYRDGVDFMMVSGDRSLYRRAGCRRIGLDYETTVTNEQATEFSDSSIDVKNVDASAIPIIAGLYALEPVRFLRKREDYERAFACSFVMNRPSDFLLISRNDHPCAYVILQRPREKGIIGNFAEISGDRSAVLGACATIMERYQMSGVHFHIGGWDILTQGLCKQAGLSCSETHASGTVRIIHFRQMMEHMRPYMEQKLGSQQVNALSFEGDDANGYKICFGDEMMHVPDRGELAHLLFGTREETVADRLAEGGKVAELMRQMLPFPAMWYGINYV